MSYNHELIAAIRLIRTKNIGSITFGKLVETLGSASEALDRISEITKISGKTIKIYPKNKVIEELELADKLGVSVILPSDTVYPPLLRKIEGVPPVLFIKGNKNLLKKASIAIVGSRDASLSGQQNAALFAKTLGEHGFLIVSGIARGIDRSAHEGALPTGTAAFLGGGIDVIYPKDNSKLYHQIAEQGVLISEFPLGTAPRPNNFPKRNRLISGMSRGVLVVEANINSGSVITAEIALEQGKDVFAIPGGVGDKRSTGTNHLIKQGAILADTPLDVIRNISQYKVRDSQSISAPIISMQNVEFNVNSPQFDNARTYLAEMISSTPIFIDALIFHSEFAPNFIMSALFELELSGAIERLPNNMIKSVNKI